MCDEDKNVRPFFFYKIFFLEIKLLPVCPSIPYLSALFPSFLPSYLPFFCLLKYSLQEYVNSYARQIKITPPPI